jgi:hypothetical protein
MKTRSPGLGLWLALTLATLLGGACSSDPSDEDSPGDSGFGGEEDASPGGRSSAGNSTSGKAHGGTSQTSGGDGSAGELGVGGTLPNAGTSATAGSSSTTTGGAADGVAGMSSAAGAAGRSEPGAAGEGSGPSTGCFVNGDCPSGQICQGVLPGRQCVEFGVLCDAAYSLPCPKHQRCTDDKRCAGPVQLGQPCHPWECDEGLRCAAGANGSTCQPAILANQPCSQSTEDECVEGTSCQQVVNFSDDAPHLICIGYVPEGSMCDENCHSIGGHPHCYFTRTCEAGLACAINNPDDWSGDTCVKKTSGALAESCQVNDCQPDLYCDYTDNICKTKSGTGQGCSTSYVCQSGNYCGPDNKCHLSPGQSGDSCYPYSCGAGLFCSASSKCKAQQADGTDCTLFDQCQGFCAANGKCTAIPKLGQACKSFDASKQACAAGYCSAGFVCTAYGVAGGACSSSASCGAGLTCDLTTSKCISDSPEIGEDCLLSNVYPLFPGKSRVFAGSSFYYCNENEFCGLDQKCHAAPPTQGMSCRDISNSAVACAAGHYCDTQGDSKCHAYAGLRQDCSSERCNAGRCGSGFSDGQCVAAP